MWVVDKMFKRHSVQKRLAIVMSLLMVLSLLWDSHLQAKADKETVVITVTDDDGVPVNGASVSYKISAGNSGSVSGDNAGTTEGAAGAVSGDNAGATEGAAGAVPGDNAGMSGDAAGSVPGGSVSGGNGNASLPEITGIGTTDIYGKMEVQIPGFERGMTISMEISKEGYGIRTLAEQPLEAKVAVTLRRIPEI